MAREKIIEIRKQRKLSQSALGKLSGLTSSEISRIECGYRDVSREEATMIAKALEVSLVAISDRPETLVPAKPAGMAASATAKQDTDVKHRGPTPLSIGANLDDPANFREMPDPAILEQGTSDLTAFRARLTEALNRAAKILHIHHEDSRKLTAHDVLHCELEIVLAAKIGRSSHVPLVATPSLSPIPALIDDGAERSEVEVFPASPSERGRP